MPPDERRTIERILADPRYWGPAHPDHEAIKADATRAFREAYPEPSDASAATTIHVRGYARRQNGEIIQASDYDRGATIARSPTSMSPSTEGRTFLKDNEGFRRRVYLDDATKSTIGYGHKIKPGESFPGGVTREQAERMFEADVAEAATAVRRLVKVDLTQAQFDAWCRSPTTSAAGPLPRRRCFESPTPVISRAPRRSSIGIGSLTRSGSACRMAG